MYQLVTTVRTLPEAIDRAIEVDPARPMITYYDKASGERTELSGTTLANWIAKSANFMRDDFDIHDESTVAIAMPAHWQTLAIVHAAWRLGATVGETHYLPASDLLVCSHDRMMELSDSGATDILVSSLDPMGRPVAVRPDHIVDYTSEVRTHGDQFSGAAVPQSAVALTAGGQQWTQADAVAAAAELAAKLAITSDDRLLMDATTIGEAGLLAWAVMPYVAGASVVLVKVDNDADAADWIRTIEAQENVTRSLGDLEH